MIELLNIPKYKRYIKHLKEQRKRRFVEFAEVDSKLRKCEELSGKRLEMIDRLERKNEILKAEVQGAKGEVKRRTEAFTKYREEVADVVGVLRAKAF